MSYVGFRETDRMLLHGGILACCSRLRGLAGRGPAPRGKARWHGAGRGEGGSAESRSPISYKSTGRRCRRCHSDESHLAFRPAARCCPGLAGQGGAGRSTPSHPLLNAQAPGRGGAGRGLVEGQQPAVWPVGGLPYITYPLTRRCRSLRGTKSYLL